MNRASNSKLIQNIVSGELFIIGNPLRYLFKIPAHNIEAIIKKIFLLKKGKIEVFVCLL